MDDHTVSVLIGDDVSKLNVLGFFGLDLESVASLIKERHHGLGCCKARPLWIFDFDDDLVFINVDLLLLDSVGRGEFGCVDFADGCIYRLFQRLGVE